MIPDTGWFGDVANIIEQLRADAVTGDYLPTFLTWLLNLPCLYSLNPIHVI
jgi:hypothetical protein